MDGSESGLPDEVAGFYASQRHPDTVCRHPIHEIFVKFVKLILQFDKRGYSFWKRW